MSEPENKPTELSFKFLNYKGNQNASVFYKDSCFFVNFYDNPNALLGKTIFERYKKIFQMYKDTHFEELSPDEQQKWIDVATTEK